MLQTSTGLWNYKLQTATAMNKLYINYQLDALIIIYS